MELTMVNGFNEMSLDEMREVDGGVAIIPVIKAGWEVAKAVYQIPPVKKTVNFVAASAASWAVGKVMDAIFD